MSSDDDDIGFTEVQRQGPDTRSKSASQVIQTEIEIPSDSTDTSCPVDTSFDHIFIDVMGWKREQDCYQALVQNSFTTIDDVVNGTVDDVFSRLKLNHPTLNSRIHAPLMMSVQIQILKAFLESFPEYFTSTSDDFFFGITTEQWKLFRRQYQSQTQTQVHENDSYQTPNRDSPFSNASVSHSPTKADIFRRERRDQSVYKVLKYDSQWLTWIDSTRRQAQAQRCVEIMDPRYRPNNDEDYELFVEKQRYMIAVWDTVLKTDKARQILDQHSDDGDAQKIFAELLEYYTNSTHAKINSRELLCSIFAAKLDPSSYSESYEKFILGLQDMIRAYEKQVPVVQRLPDKHKMSIIQNAVKSVQCLNQVITQADGIQSQTGNTIEYTKYLELLYGTAQVHDNEHKLRKHPGKSTKRNIYRAATLLEDFGSSNDDSYNVEYECTSPILAVRDILLA